MTDVGLLLGRFTIHDSRFLNALGFNAFGGHCIATAYESAPDPRVKELAASVIADEQEHLAANQAALADLASKEPEFSSRVGELVRRWLPVALECFDPPESDRTSCSRAPHTSSEAARSARREYLRRVRRTLESSGVPGSLFAELEE